MAEAFPLHWPVHVRRTPSHDRRFGSFKVTPDEAQRSLWESIRLTGGSGLIVSTNRPVRKDGGVMISAREPADPGVAVYFTRKRQSICMPCDAYDRVWKNIRAIALSIDDMRRPEGRGCAAITDQAFTGFLALPAPGAAHWTVILGLPAGVSADDVRAAYRAKVCALGAPPPEAALAELNIARDAALLEVK